MGVHEGIRGVRDVEALVGRQGPENRCFTAVPGHRLPFHPPTKALPITAATHTSDDGGETPGAGGPPLEPQG